MTDNNRIKKLTVFALTWPIFIEMLFHILMGNVDTFMLSYVSDDAVAAVGVTRQLIEFCIIIFNLIGLGVGVIIARYVGANDYSVASKVAASAISLNLIFGIVVSVLMVIYRDSFLAFYKMGPELESYATIYLIIVGGSLFLEATMLTIGPAIRSHGFTRDTMYIGMGMNVINVIGNALLIYGLFGLPQLGVAGVAISTAVSRLIGLIFSFYLLYKRIEVPIYVIDYFRIKWKEIGMTLRIGIPSALEWLSFHLSQMMATRIVTFMGTTALATHIYATNIVYFFMLVSMAIGEGTEILVAQYIGAKKLDKAYEILIKSVKWGLGITVGIIVFISFFRDQILSIFTDDPSIISIGSAILLFSIILEPGRVFNHIVINSLRAAGDVKFPLIMAIVSMWGVKVPLAYLFGIKLGYGLLGVWVAHAVDEWIRGIVHYYRWKGRKWQREFLLSPTHH